MAQTMTGEEMRWRAEENLREAFRAMARHAVEGAILEVEGACYIASGIPAAFFNPVFLLRLPDDIDGFLARTRAFYDARGSLPWTLVQVQDEGDEPLLSSARLNDVGLVEAGGVPLLVRYARYADALGRGARGISVVRVEGGLGIGHHRDVLAEAFGLPGYVTEMLIPELPPPPLRLYVAYCEGQAVGTVSLFDAGGVGGVYNLGTHPAFRGRGVGRALLAHVLEEAQWECGLNECVVQASRQAVPLLQWAGFEPLATCARFVEPKHLPPGAVKSQAR